MRVAAALMFADLSGIDFFMAPFKYDYHVLLPGYSDKLAYDEGCVEQRGTFEETKAAAYINPKALAAAGRDDFSAAIRR